MGGLFWFPERLVRAINKIRLSSLIGDREDESFTRTALVLLYNVRWELADPAAGTRPRHNYFGAPIFHSGDVVPFNPMSWKLDRIGALTCHSRENLSMYNRCGPDLRMWRDEQYGNGLSALDFFRPPMNGVRVDLMRIGGPSPYEIRCYRNVQAHHDGLQGRYVTPINWTNSNRGIDPTRVRHILDALRSGFTRLKPPQ